MPTEKMMINDLIVKIDDVIDGTMNEKRYLDNLIIKLRDQIVKRRTPLLVKKF